MTDKHTGNDYYQWVKPDGDNMRRFYFFTNEKGVVQLDLPVIEELLRQAGWRKA